MIGQLPKSLTVGGREYAIRSDFRVALNIIQAMNDPELSDREKCYVCMKCLYTDYDSIPRRDLAEAAEKAYWFIGGGNLPKSERDIRTFDWEQDEQLLFPAVNKAAGFETRSCEYLHWWSFLGYFGEIGEGLFSEVVHLRERMARHEKLSPNERRFIREHKSMIELKARLSGEEQKREDEDAAFLHELTGR